MWHLAQRLSFKQLVLTAFVLLNFPLLPAQDSNSLSFSNQTLEQEKAEKARLAALELAPENAISKPEYSVTVFTDHVGDPGKEELGRFLEEQFEIKFFGDNPAYQNVILGDYPYFFVRENGNSFLATFSEASRPFSQEEIDWLSNDSIIQNMLQTHKSYVHLQLIQMKEPDNITVAYDLLHKFAAGFCLPGQTRCVVSFPLKKFYVFDEIRIESMLEPNSIELFHTGRNRSGGASPSSEKQTPTTQTGQSPEELAKEISAKAHKSYSIFQRKLSTREVGFTYQVLVNYKSETGEQEQLWIDVMKASGNDIEGRIADAPQIVNDVKEGAIVYLDKSTMLDWLVTDGTLTIRGSEVDK